MTENRHEMDDRPLIRSEERPYVDVHVTDTISDNDYAFVNLDEGPSSNGRSLFNKL